MKANSLQEFLRRLFRAPIIAENGQLTDAELLQRFAGQRDEAAFEVLVWRYGGLVLNAARRVLPCPADAEDVFQATFLTLARKASAIRRGTAVGSWLYRVAHRLALRVRQSAARRERMGLDGREPLAPVQNEDAELRAVLAEEVDRLPERYRAAVVLCYLRGSTTEEAARILGCPRGTILSRLAWARQRLRGRLMRRGLAPAIALTPLSFDEAAAITPPAALTASVIQAAQPFAAGRAAVPTISPQVAALARGALQTMMWNKIRIAVIVICAIGLTGTGAGWLMRGRAGDEAPRHVASQSSKRLKPDAAKPEREPEDNSRLEKRLQALNEDEQKWEDVMGKELIKARLDLEEARAELQLREREWNTEREERQGKLRAIRNRMEDLSKRLRISDDRKEAQIEKFMEADREEHDRVRKLLEERMVHETRVLRDLRLKVFKTEAVLHRIETRQARQLEIYAAKRQALLERLEQMEAAPARPDAADRLRDLERKLDALRREVGKLRRDLERKGH